MSIIPRSTKIANVCVIFWGFFYCSPSFLYFGGVFNKAIIPLALVGYEMIITNSALLASLAFYHLISARGIIESEMWSSQQIFQFKQLERRSLKKSGLQRDSNTTMCGFIAQLVEHRTGIAKATGSNPVEALIFGYNLVLRITNIC